MTTDGGHQRPKPGSAPESLVPAVVRYDMGRIMRSTAAPTRPDPLDPVESARKFLAAMGVDAPHSLKNAKSPASIHSTAHCDTPVLRQSLLGPISTETFGTDTTIEFGSQLGSQFVWTHQHDAHPMCLSILIVWQACPIIPRCTRLWGTTATLSELRDKWASNDMS